MVEGYMDAISLHSHGITNAVASLGTAFTVEQARLLKKYADEIVLVMIWIQPARMRRNERWKLQALSVWNFRVAQLGDGKDPDEFVNAHGEKLILPQ